MPSWATDATIVPSSEKTHAPVSPRAPCELVLRDTEISGVHCELLLQGGVLTVSDCESTNGTFVDGRRVFAPEALPHGGVLQVGRQILKHEFRDEAEVAPAAGVLLGKRMNKRLN